MRKDFRRHYFFAVLFFCVWAFGAKNVSANETIDTYVEWNEDRTIEGRIDIVKGGKVVADKGITITAKNGAYIFVDREGEFVIKGTKKEPVKMISGDGTGYNIYGFTNSKIVIFNADISGGGFPPLYVFGAGWRQALGVVTSYYGTLEIQNVNFHDNFAGVVPVTDSGNTYKVRVSRSIFADNAYFDVKCDTYYCGDFRHSWWGNANNPRYEKTFKGLPKIIGNVGVDPWRTEKEFKDPVLIIPGIFGSFEKDGKLEIDPIFHVYDDLVNEFVQNGYILGKNLFVFPYEWRNSNVDNAKLLQTKIAEVRNIAKWQWPKADIVAHSMGGLLARQYIESSVYKNDVDQLITIGTPQRGAPESYLVWEGGEGVGFMGMVMKKYLRHEAEKKGFGNLFEYIRNRPISSFKELLPDYEYLFDVEANAPLQYPNDYPINSFLESLNTQSNVAKLANVEFLKIVGKVDGLENTINAIKVVRRDMGEKWIHGYPLGFETLLFGDRGLNRGYGDGTVPISSAKSESIIADYYLELDSGHKNLPSDAQQDVLETLTGTRPVETQRRTIIDSIMSFFVFSPIDIQVVSPNGKRIGKNFETGEVLNEIDGAYYSGYGTDSEFLTIPNPENGEYKVLTQGTGNGDYRIEAVKISENNDDPINAIESAVDITGTAELQKQEEFKVEVNGNTVTEKNKDTTPPTIVVISPESREYANDQIIEISYTVSDDVSSAGNMKIQTYYDGQESEYSVIDLAMQPLGGHSVKVEASDEAGNRSEKEIIFKVVADINSIGKNIDYYKNLQFISDQKTADFLQIKISDISHTSDMISKMDSKANPNPASNEANLLNRQIDDLIGFIQDKLSSAILSPAKEILVQSLQSVKKL